MFALSKLATCRIFLQLFVFHIASSQFLHWTMKSSCSADVPHDCIPFLATRDLDQPTKGLSVNIFNEAWVSCLNPTTRDYKESHFRIDCVMPDSEPGMSPCLRKLSLTAMSFQYLYWARPKSISRVPDRSCKVPLMLHCNHAGESSSGKRVSTPKNVTYKQVSTLLLTCISETVWERSPSAYLHRYLQTYSGSDNVHSTVCESFSTRHGKRTN